MSGFRGTTSNGDLSAYERGCPFLNTYFPMQKVLNGAKANPVMTFVDTFNSGVQAGVHRNPSHRCPSILRKPSASALQDHAGV